MQKTGMKSNVITVTMPDDVVKLSLDPACRRKLERFGDTG